MRIHKSGDKSVAFFTSYMNLLLEAQVVSKENIESYMLKQFFQGDITSLGSMSEANFHEALQLLKLK